MKRLCAVLLILACMLGCTGCICGHEWVEASCLEPKSCPLCGKVEGQALGHLWLEATCQAPQTCETCGQTQGETVDHQWLEATCFAPKTCKWCPLTEGEALAHVWQNATTEMPKTCSTCGSTEGDRIITDGRFTTAANRDLFGRWEVDFPMSGEELNIADYVEEVAFVAVIGFMEDGSLEVTVRFQDQAGFETALADKTQEMIYLQFEGLEISREDADVMFQDVYGMSVAEYAAEVWAEADWNAMLELYTKRAVYYANQDQLNIAKTWEGAFESYRFAISGDKLTITDGSDAVELTRAE